jgi:hypothetical protein
MISPAKGVIMDAVTYEYLFFQFNPVPIEESLGTNFEEMNSPGMSHPFFQYVNGKADSITFDLNLNDFGFSERNDGYTENFLKFLSRFKPDRGGARFSPPPPVIIAYGTFYRTGIIQDMKITRNRFSRDLKTIEAVVSITMATLPISSMDNTALATIANSRNSALNGGVM